MHMLGEFLQLVCSSHDLQPFLCKQRSSQKGSVSVAPLTTTPSSFNTLSMSVSIYICVYMWTTIIFKKQNLIYKAQKFGLWSWTLTKSLTHSLTHSLLTTHLLTHWLAHSLIHWLRLTHSCTHCLTFAYNLCLSLPLFLCVCLCVSVSVCLCFCFSVSPPSGSPQGIYQLHYAPRYTQSQLLRLIAEIYDGVPESFEVFYCHPLTTQEELKMFMERIEYHPLPYLLLQVNKLPFNLQEVCKMHHSVCLSFYSSINFCVCVY